MPYAVTDVARDRLTTLRQQATTALLARVNAEGFPGSWPTVIGIPRRCMPAGGADRGGLGPPDDSRPS